MSADRLREAARVLRERAEAATPGPWWSDRSLNGVIFSGTGSSDDVAVTEDFDKASDSVYIATVHPLVGLALADWLDAHAATGEAYRGPLPWLYDPEAVRLADLILGGDR